MIESIKDISATLWNIDNVDEDTIRELQSIENFVNEKQSKNIITKIGKFVNETRKENEKWHWIYITIKDYLLL